MQREAIPVTFFYPAVSALLHQDEVRGVAADGQRALVDRIALKHLGTAQDIANAVIFFASELAGFVNGQVLSVDGGR